MLEKVKLVRIRIHLPSGEIIDAGPTEVSSAPALGAFAKTPNGAEIPLAPTVIVYHRAGETTQRRFYGAAIELIEEEALIVEPDRPGIVRSS